MSLFKRAIDRKPLLLEEACTIQQALLRMTERKKCAALIVNHSNIIIGILTERDVLRKITSLDLKEWSRLKVSSIMSPDISSVSCETDLLFQVQKIYNISKIRHFPVFHTSDNKDRGNLVGLLNSTDFFKAFINEI